MSSVLKSLYFIVLPKTVTKKDNSIINNNILIIIFNDFKDCKRAQYEKKLIFELFQYTVHTFICFGVTFICFYLHLL